MANTIGGEQIVQIRAHSQGEGKLAAPEKKLNRFIYLVAMLERLGNALGTLAFTWATVVLLGGYPTVLRTDDDFWFATTIVFLEAARMFTRNNRMDYQLFFRTRGAFRFHGWNVLLTVIVYFSIVLVLLSKYYLIFRSESILVPLLVLMGMLVAVGQMLSPGALKLLCNPLRRAISLWSPFLAIVLLGLCIPKRKIDLRRGLIVYTILNTRWIKYLVIFLLVLLLTISRLRFPCIVKVVNSVLRGKRLAWRQVILNLCMVATILILIFDFSNEIYNPNTMIVYHVSAVLLVSFGNFQIPASVVRVVLALIRLVPHSRDKYFAHDGDAKDGEKNLVPSLNIFYGMVLGQGILYIVACVLEIFSFIPRRSLIRHGGFRGQLGVEYVNQYYAHAFEKCMRGNVFAPNKISLVTFAMDSLNSDSSKKKLNGVQMLHSFLKKEQLRTKTIARLTISTTTMASLFSLLGWTSHGDADIRLFAAKVTADLAGSLRVAPFPGAMQLVASLLDTDHQPKIRDHFLFINSQEAREDSPIQQVGMGEHNSSVLKYLKQMAIYCLIPVDEPSNMDGQNTGILRCWKWMTKCWSISEEKPSTDQDFLPVQGLLILERLANFDLENCMEISKTSGLISKMIDFTSYNGNYMTSIDEANQIMLAGLSLRVLKRLASTKGKLGVTLRQQILEHPFLLSNLAEILDDNGSSHELRELAAEIVKNLTMDGNNSEEIGQIRGIINSLMRAFLSRDASSRTNSYHLLRENAGQALAMLAMESVNNCLVMLMEPGYVFIKELTTMIHDDRYKYAAASLLRNMCEHAQPKLRNSELKELSHIVQEVLEGIMDAEGAELEVLIGLSSQICKVISEDFAREIEHGQTKEKFVKRLLNALNANRKPSAHCPGIRRVIVEHAICLMEYNSRYANYFHKCCMVEALSMVENTPSRAENYRLFSGDVGLMEHSTPLSTLVARAKELMGREWVRGISSVA